MKLSDFDYHLPEELIARYPLPTRSASRLLAVNPQSQTLSHHGFRDLLDLVNPHDLLVFNNTKVMPARLFAQKPSGGKVEILVERLLSPHLALAHCRSSKPLRNGSELLVEDFHITMQGREDDLFCLACERPFIDLMERHGHMPLPPYIAREDESSDRDRYQTVYAERPGAVAAPTAGLHFDAELMADLQAKAVATAFVTLHVGAGTFQPVRVDDIREHRMHSEWLEVSEQLVTQVNATRQRGGRVIAVGTTSVRALETAAQSGSLQPYSGDTRIFIYPGYRFNVVDALVTNFHLPQSTLLMLVSAFSGRELIKKAYAEAIAHHYRFFSYGDAMFLQREQCLDGS